MKKLVPKNYKKIIRICRTWPHKTQDGIGLHAYYYSKLINIQTDVFIKTNDKNEHKELSNVRFIKIKYKDFIFTKEKTNFLNFFYICISKIRGEIIMFLNLMNKIDRKNIKESIIHIHSSNFLISGTLISLIFNIPSVLQLGGTDILRIKKSFIHKFFIKKIKYFICVNRNIEEIIKSLNSSAFISNVGNSVDTDIFFSSKKDKFLFSSVGNLRWQKDHLTLIKAFKIFIKDNPKVKLLIFGEGPERSKTEKLISDLKLSDNIFLRGYCDQRTIAKYLAESYIYLHSSISEGLPKSILEAIASGCPIITTDVGSCKEFGLKYGKCVEAGNPEELAKAIKYLYYNKNIWRNLHFKCLENKSELSWEKLIIKIFNLYDFISKLD